MAAHSAVIATPPLWPRRFWKAVMPEAWFSLAIVAFFIGGTVLLAESDGDSLASLAMSAFMTGQTLTSLSQRLGRDRLPAGARGVQLSPPERFIAAMVAGVIAMGGYGFAAGVLTASAFGPKPEFPTPLIWPMSVVAVISIVTAMVVLRERCRLLLRRGQEQATQTAVMQADADRARLAVLQAQMSPHFLFNALNTVASLLATDPARAKATALHLSNVLRRTLAQSAQALSTLDDELALVRDYLDIERERFGSRLQVSFVVDPSVGPMRVPAMGLQPLVENAIKHALAEQLEGCHITVRAAVANGQLRVSVEDDGPGFPPEFREGGGLGNLRQRLQSLYGAAGRLVVDSSAAGSLVTLLVPA